MNPQGMSVKIDEQTKLKASPKHLWMQFVEPPTFEHQSRVFKEKAKLVNSIFEPEKYTRIGWRNHLVQDLNNDFPDMRVNEEEVDELVMSDDIKSFTVKVKVSKLLNNKRDSKALLFDVDVFQEKEYLSEDYSSFISLLDEIEEVYKSDDLLSLINKFLE
jgi:hypothetical protein